MLTVRPIDVADAAAFAALHRRMEPERVLEMIARSRAAFGAAGIDASQHVFVLEDADASASSPKLLGTAALAGRTGLDWPRYSYRRGTAVHASAELKMFHAAETLVLSNDHTGCAELRMPLMASADSQRAPERLLIDAMLLYVALHPDRFAGALIAGLPGVVSTDGTAPFWHGLGRHFHAGPIPRDDSFFPSPERSHVARLMPKHPLYSSFIGVDAQGCVGQRALRGRAAAESLHAQGFRHRGHIDIFDGGPFVEVDVADLTAVRAGRAAKVRVGEAEGRGASAGLVAAGAGLDFRCGLVTGSLAAGTWTMPAGASRALGVGSGERVQVLRQVGPNSDAD